MGNGDTETKFREAVNSFRAAEEVARADMTNIDQQAFKMALIDLDAALPGLHGIMRGRALLLKASAQHWIYIGQISTYSSIFAAMKDVEGKAKLEALRAEALSWAVQGRQFVIEYGGPSDLGWADSVVKKLQN